jgi:adenosylcobinamide kinase/adenosylcobinamide-phosphate guanylyltransferase
MASTLVLGAARNGKSRYASSLMAPHEVVTYVATGPKITDAPDQMWADRVEELRAARPDSWQTVVTTDLAHALIFSRNPVIIDTLSHWVWQLLDRHDLWHSTKEAIARIEEELEELLVIYQSLPHDIVAISDEVGWGGEATSGRESTYRDVLAHVNNRFSAVSQRVHVLVGGRVVDVSSSPPAPPFDY